MKTNNLLWSTACSCIPWGRQHWAWGEPPPLLTAQCPNLHTATARLRYPKLRLCFHCTAGKTPFILPKFCQNAFRCISQHLSCTSDCMRCAVSGQREDCLSSTGMSEPGGKAKNVNRLLWAALKSHTVPSGYFVPMKYCSDGFNLTGPWQFYRKAVLIERSWNKCRSTFNNQRNTAWWKVPSSKLLRA